MSRAYRRGIFASALGVVAALGVAEAALRTIGTPYADAWHPSSIAAEPDVGTPITTRYFREGIATSHFSNAYSRATGNVFESGAPVDVVLGDSYVQAIQVDDQATMGAVLERLSRAAGNPINVRQYGWSAASAAAYVAVAPLIASRWHPERVVVVLNDTDLGEAALSDWPASRITADTSLEIVESLVAPLESGLAGRVKRVAKAVAGRSVLIWEIVQRGAAIRQSRVVADKEAALAKRQAVADSLGVVTPRAVVRALVRAYGERLLIVFVGTVPASGPATTVLEAPLMRACRAERALCVSSTARMLDARDRTRRLARGFMNSAPGAGHLNALGHDLVGHLVWETINGAAGVGSSRSPSGLE